MTIYTDNGSAFLGFPEMKPPEKDQKLRLEVSAYLQANHGFSQEAAEAVLLRMSDAELGRYYSSLRANDGLMQHLGVGARSALEGKE